jgi:feruloyl esterase
VDIAGYAKVAEDGSTTPIIPGVSLADETDTFGNLDTFKKHGGKLLTFVGANDQLIFPRGVINYYREMAARYGSNPNQPDFEALYPFYRLFRAPGVGHCGGGSIPPTPLPGSPPTPPLPPQPQNLFGSLVSWVEHGIAPDQITTSGGKGFWLNQPLCLYPKTATGGGCGGNLETAKTVCADVLAKYKHEDSSEQLDFTGTGVNRQICGLAGQSANAKP